MLIIYTIDFILSYITLSNILDPVEPNYKAIFNELDKEDTGKINSKELSYILLSEISDIETMSLISDMLETDDDGYISYETFKNLITG